MFGRIGALALNDSKDFFLSSFVFPLNMKVIIKLTHQVSQGGSFGSSETCPSEIFLRCNPSHIFVMSAM